MSPDAPKSSGTLAWSPDLATGIPSIDRHHQQIFERMNALLTAISGDDLRLAGELFRFLNAHARRHFREETELMQRIGYPHVERHRRQHDEFLEIVGVLHERFTADGVTATLHTQLNQLLVDWLVKHIATEDADYVKHLKGLK